MKFLKYFFAFIFFIVFVLMNSPIHAGQVELTWTPPKTPPEFDNYRFYWGDKTGVYTHHKDVGRGATSVKITNLDDKKTYYFTATTMTASGQESKRAKEVSAYLDVDSDQDGILDQDELNIYGTDPNRADTDGDGINDGDELAFWGDLWDQDTDGDGLSHLLDRDADNDGVADGTEMNNGTDPLDPTSFDDSAPVLELLPVVSVEASDAKGQNVAANTIDGDMETRWSAEGDGQWILYDIGSLATVSEVAIAWFNSQSSFTIDVSVNGENWQEVFSGDSSDQRKVFESYPFPDVAARYVRITGYGNANEKWKMWNSINELELYGQLSTVSLPIAAVSASDAQEPNIAANTIDGDLQTRWSAEGDGQWITYDLDMVSPVSAVAIAWLNGESRQTSFNIEVSVDGESWNEVFRGDSSGTTSDFEMYTFPSISARYVRIVGHGNTSNMWNSITETEVYGQLTSMLLPIVDTRASDAKGQHVAANTIDGDMVTRWSAEGDGQWILYDIGTLATVSEVAIAWFNSQSSFTIEVSVDGEKWQEVFSGDSSDQSRIFESYLFPDVAARYVRITGYGNANEKWKMWNSINELEIYGFIN